ncbi:MAG: hypothetical protein ACETVR_03025 [Candidatus Bathyarchaeia archaeon]
MSNRPRKLLQVILLLLLLPLQQTSQKTLHADAPEELSVNGVQVPESLLRGLPNTLQFNISNSSPSAQNCTIGLSYEGFAYNQTRLLQPGINAFNISLTPPSDAEVGTRSLGIRIWGLGEPVYNESMLIKIIGRFLPVVQFSPGSTLLQGQTVSISVEVRDELGVRVGNATVFAEVGSRGYNFTETQTGFQSSESIDTNLLPMGNLTVKVTVEHENYSRYEGLYPLRIRRALLLDDHNQFPPTLHQGNPATIRVDLVDGYSGESVSGGYVSLTIGETTFRLKEEETNPGSYTTALDTTLSPGSYNAEVRGSREGFLDAVRTYEVLVQGSLDMRLVNPEAGGKVILLQGSPLVITVNITTKLGEALVDASLSARVGDEPFLGSPLSGALYTVTVDTSSLMGTWRVTLSATHRLCWDTATGSLTLTVIPLALETANSTIRSIKSRGYNVSLAEKSLETAYRCALDGNAAQALQHSTVAVSLAQGSMRATDAIKLARGAIGKAREEGRTIGLDKAYSLLSSAEESYNLGQYSAAETYAVRARRAAETAISPFSIAVPILASVGIALGLFLLRRRKGRRRR